MSRFNFFTNRPLEKYRKCDSSIILLIILLWGIGIVALYFCSSSYGQRIFGSPFHFVKRQLISSAIGFAGFLFFVILDMNKIRKLLPIMVFTSILLCFLIFVPGLGKTVNGARRWLKVPFLSTFQPSELIKMVMVLYLANFFDKQNRMIKQEDKTVWPAVCFLLIFCGCVLMHKDFSTTCFIFMVGILVFLASGAKILWLFPLLLIVVPLAVLSVTLNEYRLNRIVGYLDQTNYAQDYNYQPMAAKRAIISGGFWGQGFGSGLIKTGHVPEVQSDYIFAGWVEGTGFFGVIIYFILLGCFAWRVMVTVLTTSNRFASLASFGLLTVIVGQSLMNVAVVVGVIPSTGVPLPFFSSGGTSIIITLAMCGFIVNTSRIDKIDEQDMTIGDVIYE